MSLRRVLLCSFFFLLPCCFLFSGGQTVRSAIVTENNFEASQVPPVFSGEAAESAAATGSVTPFPAQNINGQIPAAQSSGRAELVMRAFAAAYSDRVGGLEFRDGDWSVLVYGERFYYADGRLLPASVRNAPDDYDPQPFYNYESALPPWQPLEGEENERMRERDTARRSRAAKRSHHFLDTLWRAHDRDEAWERVKQMRFLGHTVQVHYSIMEELSLVEEEILELSRTDSDVRQWMNNIKQVDGWNWRSIAETQSRSFHAYGAAIDIIPKSLGGLATYWLWTAQSYPEWWNVPYSRRFHPPDKVIEAFESFGFVWGGKWRLFDTMHFEYRPEIMILSGLEITAPGDVR